MGDSPFVQFISSLTVDSVWVGVKVVYLVAFFIYALFALVIVTQVAQMRKNLNLGLEALVVPFIWLHLGFAVLAFVLAFMLL